MNQKKTQKFEERLKHLKDGLDKPRRLKKVKAVDEHVGRLKDQFSKVAKTTISPTKKMLTINT